MNAFCKRVLDLILAFTGLLVASPLMLFIILLLRFEGAGSPVFAQKRLGKNGKEFFVYKFRKFPPDWGTKGAGVTVDGDARMTVVGRLLERSKLDELPQFINIIKGDMSFVGPRPESLTFADCFEGEFTAVLNYTPGIFGPNQIKYRNESKMYPVDSDPEEFYRKTLFPDKAKNDLGYFKNSNCIKDLYWIFQGISSSIVGTIDWGRFYNLHARIFFLDAGAILSAWVLANLIRFLPNGGEVVITSIMDGIWAFPFVMVAVLAFCKLYRNPVRYFAFEDATNLVVGVTFSLAITFLCYAMIDNRSFSVSLLPLMWLLVIPLLLLPRILRRIQYERDFQNAKQETGGMVLYGAENGGQHMARWISSMPYAKKVIGFIDDNPDLMNRQVCHFPVLGALRELDTLCDIYTFNEIWVLVRLDEAKKQQLDKVCGERGLSACYLTEMEPFRHAFVIPGTQYEVDPKNRTIS